MHAYFPLSGASSWVNCSLWPSMNAAYPGEDTQDSREGTAAHWIGTETILGRTPGPVAPNGVVITDDMRESAAFYSDDVIGTIRAFEKWGPVVWSTEKYLAAKRLHETLCGGTPDAWMYSEKSRTLIVWDFKNGFGEVSEFENMQCVSAVSALLDYLNIDGHAEQHLRVQIRIVQPRCFTARGANRAWHVVASDLRPLWNKLAMMTERATTKPIANSGPWCKYCPGRHACEAARNAAASAIDYTGGNIPEPLTPEAMSFELDILRRGQDAIKARLTGLETEAVSMMKAGKLIPGFALEGSTGRLDWKSSVSASDIRALGMMYGKSLEKPDQFVTPTQAKKLGIDEAVIKAYAESQSTGVKLVKRDAAAIKRIINRSENHV